MILNETTLRKNYQQLDYLLLTFSCNFDDGNFDEDKIITAYLNESGDITEEEALYKAKLALYQAKKVLSMKSFPEELLAGFTSPSDKPETRKQWLNRIIKKLEDRLPK